MDHPFWVSSGPKDIFLVVSVLEADASALRFPHLNKVANLLLLPQMLLLQVGILAYSKFHRPFQGRSSPQWKVHIWPCETRPKAPLRSIACQYIWWRQEPSSRTKSSGLIIFTVQWSSCCGVEDLWQYVIACLPSCPMDVGQLPLPAFHDSHYLHLPWANLYIHSSIYIHTSLYIYTYIYIYRGMSSYWYDINLGSPREGISH